MEAIMAISHSKKQAIALLKNELEKAIRISLGHMGDKSHELSWFSSQEEKEARRLRSAA